MKKIIILLGLIILAGSLLTGCGSKTITIGGMSKDFTNLQVVEDSTGNLVTLDESSSKEFYEEIKEMDFSRRSSTEEDDVSGTGYTVTFLKAEKQLDQFIILDESTIEYQGNDYITEDRFDMEKVRSFLYHLFKAEVIGSENGLLVAPEEGSDAYRSSDKISVHINGAMILDESGDEMSADQLKPGDLLTISYNGIILESYPAQITASRIDYIGHNLLLDAYMALITDIYQEDSGLNGDIKMIAFDTTEWVDLTVIEKEIILSLVKEKYGYDTLEGTFADLSEQGLIDKDNLYFPEGILIELKNMKWNEEERVLKCSISKWRSGLGAIGSDVEAEYDGGSWKLTKTGMWIS